MTIRPTSSGHIPSAGISRTGKSGSSGTPQHSSETPSPASPGIRRDAVQISAQARDLQLGAAKPETNGELAPERMREVLQRLRDGHYDQPEVQDAVLARVARDL